MASEPNTSGVDDADAAPQTVSSQLERSLVQSAVRKMATGQTPTAEERAALKRHEKERDEKLRWAHYKSIPLKHWRQMSGRQTKVLKEQAQRYGLPFGGPTINLVELAPALHDFLAENASRLASENDALLQGGNSPALERYREYKADLAMLELEERQGKLARRDVIRQGLGKIAAIIRSAGDALQRRFGPEAQAIVEETLDEAQTYVATMFVDGADVPSDQPELDQ